MKENLGFSQNELILAGKTSKETEKYNSLTQLSLENSGKLLYINNFINKKSR